MVTYSILIGSKATALECYAVRIFQKRVQQRSGKIIQVSESQNADQPTTWIIIGTPQSSSPISNALRNGNLTVPPDLGAEGFMIQSADGGRQIYVVALTPQGVLYGLGKLVRQFHFSQNKSQLPHLSIVSKPTKTVRGIYFATHFGNWYCHAPLEEIKVYLEDLAFWGVNQLLVWFDLSHFQNMEEGWPMLKRLEVLEQFAKAVGMKTGRISIANEGFKGQVGQGRPMLTKNAFADTDDHPLRAKDRLFGGFDTDICPSQAEGRKLILHNKKQLIKASSHIDSLWLWPYDQGGCNCKECLPWPQTFMHLNQEIAEILNQHAPHVKVNVSAWWFEGHQKGEDDAFFTYLEEESPDKPSWFGYIMAGTMEVKRWKQNDRQLPSQHPLILFPEISMFDSIPWGGKGGNPAPRKFATEYEELSERIEGACPYSEGRYEDLNKIIWAQMLWYDEQHLTEIVSEYCRFYFGGMVQSQAEQLIFALENVVVGKETNGLMLLQERADQINRQLEDWASQSWRWQFLRLRCHIERYSSELMENSGSKEENLKWLEGFREAYNQVQYTLNQHTPEHSLAIWVYTSADQALNLFLGKENAVNLTLEQEEN